MTPYDYNLRLIMFLLRILRPLIDHREEKLLGNFIKKINYFTNVSK